MSLGPGAESTAEERDNPLLELGEAADSGPVARVLVDSPLPQLDRLLDYRIPDRLTGIEAGIRVRVPLRTQKRLATAYVVEVADSQEFPGPLSEVAEVVSTVPVLRPEVWRLARAVADRAAGSANDVLRLAIPKRQVRVEDGWLARTEESQHPDIPTTPIVGYPSAALEQLLAARGRAAVEARSGVERLPSGQWVGRWAITLVQAAAIVLADDESAILVVPDERDQRQLLAVAEALLPAEVVVRWDARQNQPDRYRGLLRAAAAPALIIGNRSAVYAPADRLGLIAVWDDGDSSLVEPLAPYVHARDAALVRQDQQGAALILAGHVRSAETQRLVELGWLAELTPAPHRRPRAVPTATMNADEPLAAQARIPSFAWRTARAALESGPVLVQVASPGYSTGFRCADCGTPARCRNCRGPLRERVASSAPSCAWCGAIETRFRCVECGGAAMRRGGAGATRTADELGRAFPGVRIIVADGARTLFEVGDRPALVIATRGAEPLAAGGYRAVVLLDGERMLMRESLRVAEDCLRWWVGAAALASDDATVVLAGVTGPLAAAMATGRIIERTAAELADRRALRFPPAVRAATLDGYPDAIDAALAALPPEAEVIGRSRREDRDRVLLRFDYADGQRVAAAVRSEIVRQAASSRKAVPGMPPRGRRPLPLRARFDDPDPYEA